jgi:hypothetical protein
MSRRPYPAARPGAVDGRPADEGALERPQAELAAATPEQWRAGAVPVVAGCFVWLRPQRRARRARAADGG